MIDYKIADASGEASGYAYLTLTEIKNYLKVDTDTDNVLLTDMYHAAAAYIERQFKQTLKKRDIVIQFDSTEKYIDLLFYPVTSITSVSYWVNDASGTYYTSDGRVVPSEIKFATLAYIKVMYDNNRNFFDKDTPTLPPTETIQLMSPYKPIVI